MKNYHRHPRLLKVKKVQRSFAVEYKSGRRKLNSKPNSIWGDTDLKSVAQDLQDEAMPFLSAAPRASSSEMLLPGEQTGPMLTLPIGQETKAAALQETIMADENDTMTNADTPVAAAPDVPKKVRKPRAKKAVPATASAAVSAEPAVASGAAAGKQKRGRRPKADEGTVSAKRAPVKRAPKAMQIAAAPPVAAVDEIADLLQLEEENQRLRKLLAEKLRAENADLRKRLNLG
nr:transcriptional regulator [Rhizobium leguminosarum]